MSNLKTFLNILARFLKFIGKIEMPWKSKILTDKEIREVFAKARKLDLILVTGGGQFVNALFKLLPGKFRYTHSAMCIGAEKITDATSIGVDSRDMLATLNGYYRATVLRPKLTGEEMLGVWGKYKEISALDKTDNIEYNYKLVEMEIRPDGAPDSITCSQYMRVLYNAGRKNWIKLRKFWLWEAVTPNDLYDLNKFDLIYDTK
jgi:hypothetical protein